MATLIHPQGALTQPLYFQDRLVWDNSALRILVKNVLYWKYPGRGTRRALFFA